MQGAGLGFATRPDLISHPNPAANPLVNGKVYESKVVTKEIPQTTRFQRPPPSGIGYIPPYDRQFAMTNGGAMMEPNWNQKVKLKKNMAPHWSKKEFRDKQEKLHHAHVVLEAHNEHSAIAFQRCYRTQAPPQLSFRLPKSHFKQNFDNK